MSQAWEGVFKLFKSLQYILENFCAVFGMADISKYSNIWWSTHLYVSCFHQTSPILDGAPTSIFHFFCLSVYLSICPSIHPPTSICHFFCPSHLPTCLSIYSTVHTSYDNHLWYAIVKWWYLQVLLSFFFTILIFWLVRRVKGQKIVQNTKKFCLSCSISQEPYIIWS